MEFTSEAPFYIVWEKNADENEYEELATKQRAVEVAEKRAVLRPNASFYVLASIYVTCVKHEITRQFPQIPNDVIKDEPMYSLSDNEDD